MKVCSEEGCDKKYYAKSFCRNHYYRKFRASRAKGRTVFFPEKCQLEGCDEKHRSKGLCEKHYSKEYEAMRYHRDLEKRRPYFQEWQKANPDKCSGYHKKHYNKDVTATRRALKVKTANRRAAKLLRTPLWVNSDVIRQFYNACPDGYEVDHVVPLQGETVSGLHVIDNLQYLSEFDNRSKGNSFA